MRAISLFIIFGSLYRGGQSGRKTPRFLIYIPFICLGRYLHVLNLPALSIHAGLCQVVHVQTDYSLNSRVPTASSI